LRLLSQLIERKQVRAAALGRFPGLNSGKRDLFQPVSQFSPELHFNK